MYLMLRNTPLPVSKKKKKKRIPKKPSIINPHCHHNFVMALFSKSFLSTYFSVSCQCLQNGGGREVVEEKRREISQLNLR